MTLQFLKPYFFILASFIIGLLCVAYIRSKDRYEKEPFKYLLAVTVWGGIWSWAVSGILYNLLANWGVYDLRNAWGALLVIGPVEEASKLAALASAWLIIRNQLNEPVDGILYMACVALGFSLIENYYYAMDAPAGAGRLFFARLLICTPSHINFSAFMGLAFYYLTVHRKAYALLPLSFAYASMVHGIYDMIIFNGYLILPLAVTIWLAYKGAVALLGYATAKSQFRENLWTFISTDPTPYLMPGLTCPSCGSTADKTSYHLHSKTIQQCEQCQRHITTPAGLRTILGHFAAEPAKSFLGHPIINETSGKTVIDHSNDGKRLSFDLATLNNLIVKRNRATIRKMETRWWFPVQSLAK
jgi:RsiW-degrading membrane proteinase PrsW (M82 family)